MCIEYTWGQLFFALNCTQVGVEILQMLVRQVVLAATEPILVSFSPLSWAQVEGHLCIFGLGVLKTWRTETLKTRAIPEKQWPIKKLIMLKNSSYATIIIPITSIMNIRFKCLYNERLQYENAPITKYI